MNKYLLVLSQTISTTKSKIILATLIFAYLVLTSVLLNYKFFTSFYTTSVTVLDKINVTPALIIRGFQTQSPLMLSMHALIAILFALNILLVTSKISELKNPSVKFGLGAGVISLATAGCATCGLSLLTLVGLGGALTLLPYEGIEILALTTAILTATLLYNLHTLAKSCKVDKT